MNLSWRKTLAAFLIGSLLGLWGGAYLPQLLRHAHHGKPDQDRLLNKFSKELQLDAPQREAVKDLLESYRVRFDAQRTAMRQDMDKLLNAPQQKKFQEIQSRWDRR